jgi:hypothetical protein
LALTGSPIDSACSSDPGNSKAHPCRLVALAAMRHRREIGRIGLGENTIVGNETKKIVVAPFPEGYDAAERDEPASGDRSFGESAGSREAVQHAAYSCCSGFSHHRTRVVFSVARVDDHRLRQLARQCQLCRESAPLLDPRRIVVVIVEAAFTDSYASGNERAQIGDSLHRIESRCVVGMNAGRIVHVRRITGGERRRVTRRGEDVGFPATGADADYGAGPCHAGPVDYLVAVAGERRVGEVRVAVDEVWNAVVLRGHLRSIQRSTGLAT